MKESQIQSKILNHIKRKYPGAFVVKLSDRWCSGIPDIFMLHKSISCFIEVKTPKGKLSEIQAFTIDKLKECGVSVFVARSFNDAKEFLKNVYNKTQVYISTDEHGLTSIIGLRTNQMPQNKEKQNDRKRPRKKVQRNKN